jgi:pteridine reductase
VLIAGRRALVTGAGVRVGRAIALGLAERGAHVAVHYHGSQAAAEAVQRDITGRGLHAALLAADLADAGAAEALAERAAAALGGLDIIVNSAAIMERRRLADVTAADWDRTMDLNLRGPFFVSKGGARVLTEGGVIVNIADLAALERWTGYPVHVISKAGVVTLTELLAKSLAPKIRVNAVAPGVVLLPENTAAAEREHLLRTTPLGRVGSPADVVAAVVYLIEQDFVTGQTLVVDGGRRIR